MKTHPYLFPFMSYCYVSLRDVNFDLGIFQTHADVTAEHATVQAYRLRCRACVNVQINSKFRISESSTFSALRCRPIDDSTARFRHVVNATIASCSALADVTKATFLKRCACYVFRWSCMFHRAVVLETLFQFIDGFAESRT